jgi:hypothetical protein
MAAGHRLVSNLLRTYFCACTAGGRAHLADQRCSANTACKPIAGWACCKSGSSIEIPEGASRMAIYRLFKNKAFEPEAITMMTSAYAEVCRTLGLSDGDHPEANVVAEKVIEFAQRGERDPVRLRDYVLQALRS